MAARYCLISGMDRLGDDEPGREAEMAYVGTARRVRMEYSGLGFVSLLRLLGGAEQKRRQPPNSPELVYHTSRRF